MDAEKNPQLCSYLKKKSNKVRAYGKTIWEMKITSKEQGLLLNLTSGDRHLTLNNYDCKSKCSIMLWLFPTASIFEIHLNPYRL